MHPTHKSAKGFTLIELLIVIAIIGILAAIAIPQFNQYKIRGYDASAKQGLRDVALLCNAYWIDNDCSEECSLPKIIAAAYGFNQSSDLDVTLPSASSQCSNFCASAKSNSSPNTFSIDSAALISSGTSCGGAGGSVQTASVSPAQTFESYQPPEIACSGDGTWAMVDADGKKYKDRGWAVGECQVFVSYNKNTGGFALPGLPIKYVFVKPGGGLGDFGALPNEATRYNFATGMWCDDDNTRCEDYSENPG